MILTNIQILVRLAVQPPSLTLYIDDYFLDSSAMALPYPTGSRIGRGPAEKPEDKTLPKYRQIDKVRFTPLGLAQVYN
jgi:hypothetical protein